MTTEQGKGKKMDNNKKAWAIGIAVWSVSFIGLIIALVFQVMSFG